MLDKIALVRALPTQSTTDLIHAYHEARRRLLLLDYDGTLVGYFDRPEDAAPPPDLLRLIESLAAVESNTVAIVSGRSRRYIAQWFDGIPGIWMALEHGALLRPPNSNEWEPVRPGQSREWMPGIRTVFQEFVNRAPGSFIEEKEYALVWHYRMAEPDLGDRLADELLATLEKMLAGTGLHTIPGRKIVEVRPAWVHKGTAGRRLIELCGPADFVLAAGDDRTDEDLFESMDGGAWTVHVGGGESCARLSLAGHDDLLALLGRLAAGTRL